VGCNEIEDYGYRCRQNAMALDVLRGNMKPASQGNGIRPARKEAKSDGRQFEVPRFIKDSPDI
jgi:hypothetical protein